MKRAVALALVVGGCHLVSGVTDKEFIDPLAPSNSAGNDGGGGSNDDGSGGDNSVGGSEGGSGTKARPNGAPCTSATQCASGHCPTADGVCCNEPCDGTCVACTASHSGLPQGTCGEVAAGADPEAECAVGACLEGGLCCGEASTVAGGTCPAACTGGCAGSSCRIDCTDNDACKGMLIACPDGFDCDVLCSGDNSCKSATIVCPRDGSCSQRCTNPKDACTDATLQCGSGPCTMQCLEGKACSNTLVECGSNQCAATCGAEAKVPIFDCGDACDCSPCVETTP